MLKYQKFYSLKCFFFTPFNFFARTNIFWVSFFIVAGKRSSSGIILYTTFLYLFKTLITVSSFISIWIGFNPPTKSKFCCALIITCLLVQTQILFFSFQVLLLKSDKFFYRWFLLLNRLCALVEILNLF